MVSKFKRTTVVIWAMLASAGAITLLLFTQGNRHNSNVIEEKAEHAKKNTKQKIENTPASELVDSAANATDLCKVL